MAVRKRKRLIQKGAYKPPDVEEGEEKGLKRILDKGKSRYTRVNFAVYGGGGLLLMTALNLGIAESWPLQMWIIVPLFAAWCGAAAAAEKWKRKERMRTSGGGSRGRNV